MSFLEHLEEFRTRIIRSCIAIAIGMVLAFAFIERIVAFVFGPMRQALPQGATLIYTQPGEAFSLYIDIALIAGTGLAAPYIMFQVWRFIAPALYTNEKRFAIPFVVMSSGGTAAGWLFSHYIMFPYMIAVFQIRGTRRSLLFR
jgi:sec-independent protein translocase protein TatC